MPLPISARTIHSASEIWTPIHTGSSPRLRNLRNAAIVVDEGGLITEIGENSDIKANYPSAKFIDHGSAILVPGFIDGHLHCPQLDVIGSGGYGLLDWLDKYVFPAEAAFKDVSVAHRGARRLTRELIRHGITSAAVFSSVHAHAADALFDSFNRAGLRLVTGKTSMDVGAPNDVLQSVADDFESQEVLISKWHGREGRLFYAITPRFALSCSPAMMKSLQALREKHTSCFVQTHISENVNEVKDVMQAWKGYRDYLAVYEDHGLLGSKTLLAHGIYLTDSELSRVAKSGTSIVHCPTSNTFLGSGLFNLQRSVDAGAKVCLASDIGGGTGLSPWQSMLECYKIQALQGCAVSAEELLYRATLAGAEALGMDHQTGSLEIGKYADFVVVRPDHLELLGERLVVTQSPADRLFACITYGDDRIVDSVYVAGKRVTPPLS